MITTIGNILTEVISWCGEVLTSIVSETGALKDLKELVFLGVGISLVLFGGKLIRSLTWGA